MGDSVARHPYAFAVAALLLAGCGASGTGREAAAGAPAARLSAGDRAWLVAIHQDGLADVRYGRLAERRGATSAVRRAGTMLVADHVAFEPKVVRTAHALRIDLPRAERAGQLALGRRLENEAGTRFDRDFVAAMAEAHEKAIARTEDQVRDGSSPELTDLARTVLPALREHLETLRRANPIG
jgi:putative membrane protein